MNVKSTTIRLSIFNRAVSRVAVFAIAGVTLAACSSAATENDDAAVAVESISAPTSVVAPIDTTIPPPPSTDDILTTIEASDEYPTFVKLVNQAGLADTLKTSGPFTMVIPSEAAFTALSAATLSALEADPVELARVLKYHVVPALVAPDPAASGPVETLEGATLDAQFTATNTTINGAQVLTSPRATTNGAYIAIDKVLIPPAK
jgi:hypothetical protein